MDKTYQSVATRRAPRPRSPRLQALGAAAGSTSSTIVNISGTTDADTGAGMAHTHPNKYTLDKISADADLYLYLDKLEENAEGTEGHIVPHKARAGYADQAAHAVQADKATHADKAHDVDEDSPVYNRFLRKDVKDEAAKAITFLEGLLVGKKGHGISVDAAGTVTAIFDELKNIFSLVSPGFVSGDLGAGYILKQDPESGESYLEVDRMLVRKLAYFVEMVIKRLSYVGGEIILTPASMKCSRVETLPAAYRCYFLADDGSRSIKQEFRAGDQARCQTFNVKEGDSHNVKNTYYWRLVTATGDDYIDLSKTDCDTGSSAPQAGDEIVQLGNRTDATRQNAIILSTVGDDAPSIKQYKGINAYALAGKEVTVLSPALNKIIGQFISEATGKSYDALIGDLQADMALVKEQTDREYTLWFFEYAPTLTNIPASEWTTDELKAMHEEDMFYNRASGRAYRFIKSGSTWEWADITDQQTVKALENAAKAQDTADGKRRVFVAQPRDAEAYDVGDMWVNATYGSLYSNDQLRCKTAKAAGAAFSIDHWQPASNATTAYIKNLGDSILLVVSSNKNELDGLITQNQQSTNSAISQAQAAATAASSAMNKALEAFNKAGTAQDSADKANGDVSKNATAIQLTDNKITTLASKVTFDASGNITNINKSGLVTTDDMNSLITEKFTFDASGNITNISKSGLVTEVGFAGLFTAQMTAEGLVKKADISTFITRDAAGELISNAVISADQIRFNGNIVANDTFVVDKAGNLTLNNITGNNVHFLSGQIAGMKISGNSLTNAGFDNDATIILRNDYYGIFSAIGTNTLPASSGLRAVARFENKNTREGTLWGSTNYAVIINAANAANNYALLLENGYIGGFRIKTLNVSSSTTYDKVSNAILLSGKGTVVLTLPTLTQSENGQFLMVKNVDGGVKRVKPSAGQPLLLDQQTWVTSDSHEQLATAGDAMTFVFFWGVGRENKGDTGTWVQWKNPQNW